MQGIFIITAICIAAVFIILKIIKNIREKSHCDCGGCLQNDCVSRMREPPIKPD